MSDIRFTVITVCLNSEATIRQTIESVLQQTYKNIEYMIVDGGSTDKTLDIIREYVPLFDGKLQYISERDNGIYDAMNKGILRAAGDAIGIINSDDWYEKDALEKVAAGFQDAEADVVYGEMWLLDQNGEREYHTSGSTFPPHPSTFIKREIYQKYGLFDLSYRIAADRELLLRFMAAGVRFRRIDAVLANFRRTGISNVSSLECARETHDIDLKYLGKCSESMNRDAIEEKYEREKLLYISQNQPQVIQKILAEKNDVSDAVVIFGSGNCGKELLSILETCNIPVCFFVDNDSSKWGLEFQGIKIFSPEILRYYNRHVVVTVSRYQKEICGQLQKYENPDLSWSILSEIRKRAICECNI